MQAFLFFHRYEIGGDETEPIALSCMCLAVGSGWHSHFKSVARAAADQDGPEEGKAPGVQTLMPRSGNAVATDAVAFGGYCRPCLRYGNRFAR